MTCKVRRDFKIITDVLSRVSLVTSNIRGSSICSPKSLYKKTSNGRVEGSCQNGCVKGSGGPDPSYPSLLQPICSDRHVSNSQPSPTPRHHLLFFYLRPGPKMLFQGDTPEGSDTFQWPVVERDHVGGLRLMIWDKVKVPLCHYSDAPEESDLWTAWQLFPLDDD